MKYVFLLFVFATQGLFAQTEPEGVNFQFIARDTSGLVFDNKSVDVEVLYFTDYPTQCDYFDKYKIEGIKTNKFGLGNLVLKSQCWAKVKYYTINVYYNSTLVSTQQNQFWFAASCCGFYGCSELCLERKNAEQHISEQISTYCN